MESTMTNDQRGPARAARIIDTGIRNLPSGQRASRGLIVVGAPAGLVKPFLLQNIEDAQVRCEKKKKNHPECYIDRFVID